MGSSLDLSFKWELVINSKSDATFRVVRISPESIPELYLGVDQNGMRCFMLYLPESQKPKIIETKKEKLSLEYLIDSNVIIIRLNDPKFSDLFDDLILSLYSKLKDISDSNIYVIELISLFNKWAEFFENAHDKKLSYQEIIGLYGELLILKEFITNNGDNHINDLLLAWKGPYDTSNDFAFENKNLEVKTKKATELTIKISSEFQLEAEFGKDLELCVVSVNEDPLKGDSLCKLLNDIIDLTRSQFGDLSILYDALWQKWLTLETIKEYDNYRFVPVNTRFYNAGHEDFPKLVKSNLPQEVSHITYQLRVNTLDTFFVREKQY